MKNASTERRDHALAHLFDRRLRTLVVVAHPDDETIGAGGHLDRIGLCAMLHLTDGAPLGTDRREEYAAIRRAELYEAMSIAGIPKSKLHALAVPDQQLARELVGATRMVLRMIRDFDAEAILTHSYEGGHPDHDAAAFIVQAACALLRRFGINVARIEMPLYHRFDHTLRAGTFLPASQVELAVELGRAQLERKRRMLACFASQPEILRTFDPRVERFRFAPAYDFSRAPHAGQLHYETLGWPMRGREWRALAVAAREALGLAEREMCR